MMQREKYLAVYTMAGAFTDEKVAQRILEEPSAEQVLVNAPRGLWHSANVSLKREERFTNSDGSREVWLDNGSENLYTLFVGEAFTLEEIKERNVNDEFTTLISNMEGNQWSRVALTRHGSWRPLEDKDIVVPEAQVD